MRKRKSLAPNTFESFSDIALLMLATFIFLLVTVLITSKLADNNQVPELKEELAKLKASLDNEQAKNRQLLGNLDSLANMSTSNQMELALQAAGLDKGKNRKDFDLFVIGLKSLPGKTIHLMVDATGSMHGASSFLIPVLRVIVIRSGKQLTGISWFSDHKTETYSGSMGEMLDRLMGEAPFIGHEETIGKAFQDAATQARIPSAYLLIGDEPATDRINYFSIPAPVFTLPLGRDNPQTTWEYERLANKTGGKILHLNFQ